MTWIHNLSDDQYVVFLPICLGTFEDVRVCVLQDIALEAAIPKSSICRLRDWDETVNEMLMSTLSNGEAYNTENTHWRFKSGSRTEGLALEDGWGHDNVDEDVMHILGGSFGVNVPGGQQPRGKSCLDFHPEGCPVAYCKLEVTDISKLKENSVAGRKWIDRCVHRSGGKLWLDTYQAVRGSNHPDATVSGPAVQSKEGNDSVFTLVCNGSHPELHREFPSRVRQWPPASLINLLMQLPMLLVLVGHKLSPEFNLQARISWSYLELKLFQEVPESVRHGYIACKYVLKHFLKLRRGKNESSDGRSRVGSYHIKTVFLRYLEKTPPTLITSPFKLFLDILHELNEYLDVGKLPHYFLAQCDLLETVESEERCITREVIREILAGPLNALLTSPTRPKQIYGNVRPDKLVVAFHKVSVHPICEQSRKKLLVLLARVDKRRRQRYIKQRKKDDSNKTYDGIYKVTGRTELTGLVDTLKLIKQN